jgi:glycosyltransferase involved in cell wall biosynthesis
MKIILLSDSCAPFDFYTLEKRPLGGIETAVIRFAKALNQSGHDVRVLTGQENPQLSDPLFLPFSSLPLIGAVDVLISVRRWLTIFAPLEAKIRLFWTGDAHDQMQVQGLGDRRVVNKMDGLLCVSEWHKEMLCQVSGFPMDKSWLLRNGIDLELFKGSEKRTRKRLIYSSTPYRGLVMLPYVFEKLKGKHSELELHIFSGYDVYKGAGAPPSHALHELQELKEKFSRLPGCFFHGNKIQSELAREFMKSAILCYPNTFAETSCITALEAQAGGCAIVTSKLGALPETVAGAGILIEQEPGSSAYIESFIDAVDHLLSDDALWQKYCHTARSQSQNYDWKMVASKFTKDIEERFSIT